MDDENYSLDYCHVNLDIAIVFLGFDYHSSGGFCGVGASRCVAGILMFDLEISSNDRWKLLRK